MRKILLLSLMLIFVFTSTSLYAADKYALGNTNIALKVDYISFTGDIFETVDLKDGVYIGLEGYYGITSNLYVGLEAGWAETENNKTVNLLGDSFDVKIDVDYVPVELNLKYVIEASPQWLIALGAGVSYNWFDVQQDVCGECSESDWVVGGQVFADITYRMSNQWFIGINGKYQFTDDLKFDVKGIDIETDTNANNWRVGAQVGLMFK
jgi:opacity protein-like surface antigen